MRGLNLLKPPANPIDQYAEVFLNRGFERTNVSRLRNDIAVPAFRCWMGQVFPFRVRVREIGWRGDDVEALFFEEIHSAEYMRRGGDNDYFFNVHL